MKLPNGFISYFLALVPKISHPQWLNEFWPISLLGCLSSRLRKALEKTISGYQSAFLPGRHILDGVVAINEVVDFARKKKKKECFVFKVDFEKTYDSVNWIS